MTAGPKTTGNAGKTAKAPVTRQHGNAYNIFILVLTIYSLAIMVVLLLPIDPATRDAVNLWDNVICVVFLIDFGMNLYGSRPKGAYFIHQRGWLDLLGSIPSFGFIPFTALFRLARLSRLARIRKLMSGQAGKDLVLDVLNNRGQYATFITILLAGMILSVASVLILQFEVGAPDGNIKTGGEALWWAIVTITTVGYGDYYPVTFLGRLTAVFVMFAGIGIIGALASILASLLVAPSSSDDASRAAEAPDSDAAPGAAAAPAAGAVGATAAASAMAAATPMADPSSAAIAAELASLRAEIAALREALPTTSG
jgi:voltage-gated potassium channel